MRATPENTSGNSGNNEAKVHKQRVGVFRRRYGALVAGLSWWQTVLVLAPLPLIPMGGAVGGLIGGTAAGANATLARRNRFGAGITALSMTVVCLSAYGLYFAVAGTLLALFTTSPPLSSAGGAGGPVPATVSPAPYHSPVPAPQWKAVPAGVAVNAPAVINATGPALTWPPYVNTTGDAPYDVARYEIYRSTPNQNVSQTPGDLIGTVSGSSTGFTDSSAPARTGPQDGVYNYVIAVRTKGGGLIPGPAVLVQLPLPGRTEVALPATDADTIGSGAPNAGADAVITHRSVKHLELGPDEDLGLGNTRLVFDFGPLPVLPKGAAVVEAHLGLWRTSGGNYPQQYTLYALRRSFTGSEVTWNSASAGRRWSRPGGDFGAPTGRLYQELGLASARTDFDATAAVRGWEHNPASEHGLLLKADIESVRTAPLLAGWYVPIGGTESPSNPPSQAPELYVTYTGAAPATAVSAAPSP